MKEYGGINLGASWRLMASFTTQSLYLSGKCPQYPMYRRLGGPENWSGQSGEEKILDLTRAQILTPLS
jgi:hypothetical protein